MSAARMYGVNRTIHKDVVMDVEYNYPSWMPFTVKFLPNEKEKNKADGLAKEMRHLSSDNEEPKQSGSR